MNSAIGSISSDVFTAEVIYHTRVDWERVAAHAIGNAVGTGIAEAVQSSRAAQAYERESKRTITKTTQTDIELQEMRYELTGDDALSYMAAHPAVMEAHPDAFELPSRPSEGRATRVTSEVNPGSQRTQPIHQSQSMQTGYGSFWSGKQKQPTTTLRTELANDNPANLSKKNTSTYTQQKAGLNAQQQRSKVTSKTEALQNQMQNSSTSTLDRLANNQVVDTLVSMDEATQRGVIDAINLRMPNPTGSTFEQMAYSSGYGMAYYTVSEVAVAGRGIINAGLALARNGFFKAETATNATAKGNTKTENSLLIVLKDAKQTPGKPNQLEITLADGTKIFFRKDVGEYAHPIGKIYKEPVDHFNIEVHSPNPTRPGRYIVDQNMHVVVDKNLKPIDVFLKNKNDIKPAYNPN